MNGGPLTISAPSLAEAWCSAFSAITKPGVTEIAPLIVTFAADTPRDHPVQRCVDDALRAEGEFITDTVATTMFPKAFWNPSLSRDRLYTRYAAAFPLIHRVKQNKYGTYFQRLIAFESSAGTVNQLEKMFLSYESGNHRRSALQATVFDPARDHTKQRQRGFPCLQQVSFALVGTSDLHVNAFYATEYLFEKAYGNYLGLRDLGAFAGAELGRTLTRVTCYAGIALRGDVKMSTAQSVAACARKALGA